MPNKDIEALSKKISDLQSGIETVSTGATWGVILSCVAIVLIVTTIIVLRFFSSNVRRQDQIRDTIREYLAIGIVIVGICIVGILGVVAMATGDANFRREAMAGILPLIGAWVGAVIAYYFGKENFQAASDSTAKLLSREEQLAKTPISKLMILIDQAEGVLRYENLDEVKKLEVRKLVDDMPLNRAPVLTKSNMPLLILHKSTLYEYLAMDSSHKTHTMKDFNTGAPNLWLKIMAFGTVTSNATAADVKLAIRNVGPDCADVFATKDGTKSSEVIGWITNVDLLKAEHL